MINLTCYNLHIIKHILLTNLLQKIKSNLKPSNLLYSPLIFLLSCGGPNIVDCVYEPIGEDDGVETIAEANLNEVRTRIHALAVKAFGNDVFSVEVADGMGEMVNSGILSSSEIGSLPNDFFNTSTNSDVAKVCDPSNQMVFSIKFVGTGSSINETYFLSAMKNFNVLLNNEFGSENYVLRPNATFESTSQDIYRGSTKDVHGETWFYLIYKNTATVKKEDQKTETQSSLLLDLAPVTSSILSLNK